jgi:hypothetical protein
MSSEAAAVRHFEGSHSAEVGDGFFAWADVESRNNTMSVGEAASLLGVSVQAAIDMINEGILCASVDATTGEHLFKTACVRAQLADSVSLSDQPGFNGLIPATEHLEEGAMDPLQINTTELDVVFRPEQHLLHELAAETIVGQLLPSPEPEKEVKPPFDRAAITAKNIEALMDSLDFANVRLEGSMYRIGYLEAQVNSLEEQLTVLNEFRARAARAILTERENVILKEKVEILESRIRILERGVDILDGNLVHANSLLMRIEQTWWYRLCSWLFRFKLVVDEPTA